MRQIINTGIIGFGLSGRVFHAPFVHTHPGYNLKKVIERHNNDSKKIYPYVEVVRDYKDLLADKDIDLIVVTTENTLHFPMVKESLLAGKNVVVEKPFTPASDEADELIELSETTGKKIFVYQNRRWDGDFMTIKKILNDGILGDIQEYEAHFDRYKPELTPGKWRDEDKPGGGILYDLGSHLIDQALQLFGKPKSLTADIQSQRPGSRVDDYFRIEMFYPAAKVILTAGMMVKEPGPRFIIHGTNGSFIKYGIDPQEEALANGRMPEGGKWGVEDEKNWGFLTTESDDEQVDGRIVTEPGNYMKFYDNVYDVLLDNAEQAVKPEEGMDLIRIIELAFESNRENEKVII